MPRRKKCIIFANCVFVVDLREKPRGKRKEKREENRKSKSGKMEGAAVCGKSGAIAGAACMRMRVCAVHACLS